MKLKISNRNVALAGVAVVLASGYWFFGFMGVKVLAAMILFFFLPFYLILKSFGFEPAERVFFSFFMGIGLFSAFVFYAGRVVPSFRFATAIALVALLLVPFAIRKFLREKKRPA